MATWKGASFNVDGPATFSSTVALSANPTTALQATPKQYVDALPRALGYMGHVSRATDQTGISVVTLIDSITFSAVTGRRYKVSWTGGYNNSDGAFTFRWIAGATIAANTGTQFASAPNSASGTNINFSMWQILSPGVTGNVTVGCTADGVNLKVIGNNNYNRLFLVEDIGT